MFLKHALALIGSISVAAAEVGPGVEGVSWGAQRIDLFGADSSNNVYHKYFTAFGWGPDDAVHGNLEHFTNSNASSPISVASWGANRLDFVFVDKEGNALHKYWDGTSWGPDAMDGYDILGRGVEGKPAIASWGPDRFDVVVRSADQTYNYKTWTGRDYYPHSERWLSLGGEFASAPATVSWGYRRLDIFGITNEGRLAHKYWDGSQWNPRYEEWEDLGAPHHHHHEEHEALTGELFASSPTLGRFDIWAISNETGSLWHLYWDGFQYQDWENLGGNFTNAPQIAHWSPGRIDLLGKSPNGTYLYNYWDGHQWSDWTSKGDGFDSEPALVSIGEGNLNLVGVDTDGKLKLQVWDGSQWLPAFDTWYELGDTVVADDSNGGDDSSVMRHVVNVGEKVLGDVFGIGGRIELRV